MSPEASPKVNGACSGDASVVPAHKAAVKKRSSIVYKIDQLLMDSLTGNVRTREEVAIIQNELSQWLVVSKLDNGT